MTLLPPRRNNEERAPNWLKGLWLGQSCSHYVKAAKPRCCCDRLTGGSHIEEHLASVSLKAMTLGKVVWRLKKRFNQLKQDIWRELLNTDRLQCWVVTAVLYIQEQIYMRAIVSISLATFTLHVLMPTLYIPENVLKQRDGLVSEM